MNKTVPLLGFVFSLLFIDVAQAQSSHASDPHKGIELFIFFIVLTVIIGGFISWISEAEKKDKQEQKELEELQFKEEMRGKVMGNTTVNVSAGGDISGNIVLGDLIATNSFNTIKDSNIEVAGALEEISGHISKLGIKKEDQASIIDVFSDLQDKILSGKGHMIKMAWSSLLEYCPSIKTLTSAVAIIEGLFG